MIRGISKIGVQPTAVEQTEWRFLHEEYQLDQKMEQQKMKVQLKVSPEITT